MEREDKVELRKGEDGGGGGGEGIQTDRQTERDIGRKTDRSTLAIG